jgi:hypothetical protein
MASKRGERSDGKLSFADCINLNVHILECIFIDETCSMLMMPDYNEKAIRKL